MPSGEHATEVAFVGGGPVGLALALFLDRYGIKSAIFNSEPTTRWHPKGNTHNQRTMEHFRRFGLADDIRALGMPWDHPPDVDEGREVLHAAASTGDIGRSILTTPGVPPERLAALRGAFQAMLADPAFLAACEQRHLMVDGAPGEGSIRSSATRCGCRGRSPRRSAR